MLAREKSLRFIFIKFEDFSFTFNDVEDYATGKI
jgi:hypothetical protein